MKKNIEFQIGQFSFRKTIILVVLISCLCLVCKAQITVVPVSNDNYLINPGKGWVIYSNFSNADSSAWAKASVGYTRFDWKDIHIAENTYNWSIIDNALNDCINRGKLFAFGVMSCNVNSSSSYASMPQWVIDAGAQYYLASGAPDCKIPVWNDSIFIDKIQQFVNALSLRYNGNKNIAFIDNRIYGNWGEWHLYLIGGSDPGNSIKNSFVDMFSIFDKTFIIQPNSGGEGSYEGGFAYYARDTYNMGWREDSSDDEERWTVCSLSSEYAPNVAEWSTSYANLEAGAGWTGEFWSDQMVSEAVLGSHYSYQNFGQWNGNEANTFLAEKEYLIDEWQNKMGYWFKITSATFPGDLANGTYGIISFSVKNDGVARQCIKNSTGCVKLALLDNDYNVLQTIRLPAINPINWAPFQTTNENADFSFPFTSGATKLGLGVFSDSTLTIPDTKLGINNGTPDNWYILTDMVDDPEGIAKEDMNSSILVYPNPVTDIIIIDLKHGKELIEIKIYDINGRNVYLHSGISKKMSLNVSGLPSGLYILEANSSSNALKIRFIKM